MASDTYYSYLGLHTLATFRAGLASGTKDRPSLTLADVSALVSRHRPVQIVQTSGDLFTFLRSTRLTLYRALTYFIKNDPDRLFLVSGIGCALLTTGQALVPFLTQKLLALYDDSNVSAGDQKRPETFGLSTFYFGLLLSLCMAVSFSAQFAGSGITWISGNILGLRSQIVLLIVGAGKSFFLKPSSRSDGEQQMVFSRYSTVFSNLFSFLHNDTWAPCVFICVAMYNLHSLLGSAAWVALAVQATCTSLAFLSRSYFRAMDRSSNKFAVQRIGLLKDALSSMLALRASGWDRWFLQRINNIRNDEVRILRKAQLLRVIVDVAFSLMQAAVLIAAFLSHAAIVGEDQPLSPTTAFASITWIAALGTPMKAIPAFIQSIADTEAFTQRYRNNLERPEMPIETVQKQWKSTNDPNLEELTVSASVSVDKQYDSSSKDVAEISPPSPSLSVLFSTLTSNRKQIRHQTNEKRYSCCRWSNKVEGTEAEKPLLNDDVVPDEDLALPIPSRLELPMLPIVFNNARVGSGTVILFESVSFACARSSLTILVGPTGSGKTTLLRTLTGDVHVFSGNATVHGSIAYLSQDPWIQRTSFRKNITFGSSQLFNALRYEEVIDACCLRDDIQRLGPQLDETIIADDGANISGGQRARLALARSLYAGADVYILDDIFSALDPVVGQQIWDRVIVKMLLGSGKTVLLATHGLKFLDKSEVSQIVLLERNIQTSLNAETPSLSNESLSRCSLVACGDFQSLSSLITSNLSKVAKMKTVAEDGIDSGIREKLRVSPTVSVPTVSKLDAQVARITRRGLLTYFSSFGTFNAILLPTLYVVSQASTIIQSLWLKVWADQEQNLYGVDVTNKAGAEVFGIIGSIVAALTACRMLALALATTHAGLSIHREALSGIFRAPSSFFIHRQSGEILNRFEKDIDHLDWWIRPNVSSVAVAVFSLLGSVFVIGYATPIVLVWVAVVSGAYYFLGGLYRKVVITVRSLDAASSSGAVTFWKEINSLNGAAYIRSLGPEATVKVLTQLLDHFETFMTTRVASYDCSTLAGMFLSATGNTITVVAAIVSVCLSSQGAISSSSVGLLLSYAFSIPNDAANCITNLGYLEQSAISIERIAEFVHIEGEDGDQKSRSKIKKASPSKNTSSSRQLETACSVSIQGLGLRYSDNEDLPWAIRNFSLEIPAGSKVAIIGRTGSGKSSLFQALLRLYKPQEGRILIGDEDLSSIYCARDVRSRMGVLLQSGMILPGTLRENLLGPRSEGDDEVPRCEWENHRIIEFISKNVSSALASRLEERGGLDTVVSAGGAIELSKGERALLSLTRLLLTQELEAHENKIKRGLLLLDEPSADIDLETDAILHETLLSRPETLLCISHRQDLLFRFDIVVTMSNGSIEKIEYNSRKQ